MLVFNLTSPPASSALHCIRFLRWFAPVFLPWLWEKKRLADARDRRFPLTPRPDYSSDVAWVWLVEMRQSTRAQPQGHGSVGADQVCHQPLGTGMAIPSIG
jgi:hypothetical protein